MAASPRTSAVDAELLDALTAGVRNAAWIRAFGEGLKKSGATIAEVDKDKKLAAVFQAAAETVKDSRAGQSARLESIKLLTVATPSKRNPRCSRASKRQKENPSRQRRSERSVNFQRHRLQKPSLQNGQVSKSRRACRPLPCCLRDRSGASRCSMRLTPTKSLPLISTASDAQAPITAQKAVGLGARNQRAGGSQASVARERDRKVPARPCRERQRRERAERFISSGAPFAIARTISACRSVPIWSR